MRAQHFPDPLGFGLRGLAMPTPNANGDPSDPASWRIAFEVVNEAGTVVACGSVGRKGPVATVFRPGTELAAVQRGAVVQWAHEDLRYRLPFLCVDVGVD